MAYSYYNIDMQLASIHAYNANSLYLAGELATKCSNMQLYGFPYTQLASYSYMSVISGIYAHANVVLVQSTVPTYLPILMPSALPAQATQWASFVCILTQLRLVQSMAIIESAMLIYSTILTRVKTGSGHPGQPYHILSGSNGSNQVYKISRGMTWILHCIMYVNNYSV